MNAFSSAAGTVVVLFFGEDCICHNVRFEYLLQWEFLHSELSEDVIMRNAIHYGAPIVHMRYIKCMDNYNTCFLYKTSFRECLFLRLSKINLQYVIDPIE